MSRSTSNQWNALAVCMRLDVPAILWGPPGTGKSKTVEAIAKAFELECITVIASLREPTDFSGLPLLVRFPAAIRADRLEKIANAFVAWINVGKDKEERISKDEVIEALPELIRVIGQPEVRGARVDFAPPSWAVRLSNLKKAVLFLDEISTARPAVQAALLRVVLDRCVGDMKLPDGIRIFAAANPAKDTPGCWDLNAPLANRFCHIEWRLDAKDWCDGFLYNWPIPRFVLVPEDWENTNYDQTKTLVTAFIRSRPELLLQVPEDEVQAGGAWPSGRSWEMAAKLHAACAACAPQYDSIEARRELEIELVQGCVGNGPALEFFTYVDKLNLIDPELLLSEPMKHALPTQEDELYAVLGSMVIAFRNTQTEPRWKAAWVVLGRAAQQYKKKDVAAIHALALSTIWKESKTRFPAPAELQIFVDILQKAQALPTAKKPTAAGNGSAEAKSVRLLAG